ncbi:phosphoglucosamine mutase [Dehalogenimonas etheniformans]|uniref:phosphoglucosamine mutase n=1 Tax=Dehalogenimonas etheniformans TaxID=1536648 RepID=UPI00167F1FFF|nr:phosphoglucosamine mutase [Dehalogenimonas etheniformans]QNT76173.1 phosphoglucosamine mutase [Dehalogenimonas etheniformans]
MGLFGSSGIRQPFNEQLVDVVFRVGRAVGSKYPRVIVGCDTRTSSDALKHIAVGGLSISGAKSFDAGLVPTPTLAFAARKFDCGLMVTASHNPPEYNGIKLFNPDGSSFSPDQQQEIETIVSAASPHIAQWGSVSWCSNYHGAVEQHINQIRKIFPQSYHLKVVVDCACGAASDVTPNLLRALGCSVLSLNSNPSGFFPHAVEPLEENLSDLINAVRKSGADFGIAHDGDADRMMAVDDAGRFITGDKMLCLLAAAERAQKVVTTVDASAMIDRQGYQIARTRVGDSFVSEALKNGGDFGGEPSGAWIFPRNTLCPDGIFAVACLVDLASKAKLSTKIDHLIELPIRRGSLRVDGLNLRHFEQELISLFNPRDVDYTDGIKLNFTDGWILVRASGTEPKIRFTVEGEDESWVQQTIDKLSMLLSRSR